MSGSITKTCNKCKKALAVEVFGDNGRGACFKNCDACRSRGRAEQARTLIRRREANSNTPPDDSDVVEADELVDATVISSSNRNLFVRGVHAYLVLELQDVCIKFCNPKSAEHCITMLLNERVRLSIRFGSTWGEIKELLKTQVVPKTRIASIMDDTVCNEKNIANFMEKILYLNHGEAMIIKKCYDEYEKFMGISLTFETTGHELMLSYGVTWKRVRDELALDPDRNILCPLCLDDLYPVGAQRAHSICHECGVGVCGDCIINRFIDNGGVMVCCRCKFSIGTPAPAYLLQKKAEELRDLFSTRLV
jgi:hypothetical protein